MKSYAKTFTENKLNYAFVGQHPKDISEAFGITETFDTAHPTLFDSLIVLSDGSELLPAAEEFAELTYKHNKPIVVNQSAAQGLANAKLNLEAPGVFVSDDPQTIVQAFDRKRYWNRK
ncbi:catalase [Staphylococcus aureus]|nr:catalase [Staphylococcus aureus]